VAADVENDVVLRGVDVLDELRVGQELLDLRVLDELGAFIVGGALDAGLIDRRVSALGRGKVNIEAGGFKRVVWVRGLGKVPTLMILDFRQCCVY
jgi:hypothetical protein